MNLKRRLAFTLLNIGIGFAGFIMGLFRPLSMRMQAVRFRHFHFKPRPGDIYVATFPKAGTTWIQMIVYQLITGGRGEFDHILQVSPYYDALVFRGDGARLLEEAPSPRILKTHLLYEEVKPPGDSKVIYVTRNLGDTIVSRYHHACLEQGGLVDFQAYARQSLRVGGRSWFAHLESWWPRRNDPNVLHLRYEDLTRDLEGGIRRIAAFCGIPIDESRMGEILTRCSFAYMKQHDLKFDFRTAIHDRKGIKTAFIRKGGVGGARQELDSGLAAQMEDLLTAFRRRMGIGDSEL